MGWEGPEKIVPAETQKHKNPETLFLYLILEQDKDRGSACKEGLRVEEKEQLRPEDVRQRSPLGCGPGLQSALAERVW